MSKPRLRPLLFGILVFGVLLISALSARGLPSFAAPRLAISAQATDVTLSLQPTSIEFTVSRFKPDTEIVYLTLQPNPQNVTATVDLDFPDLPSGWTATLSPPPIYEFTETNKAFDITLQLTVPPETPLDARKITLRATLLSDKLPRQPVKIHRETLSVSFKAGPATAGDGCPDSPAPGTDFDSARLLRVDSSELHGLCENGEQDWFKFVALGGKYYTIEIQQTDPGVDLAIDLYDEQEHQITSNDDFPLTPAPTSSPPPSGNPSPSATAEPPPRMILPRIDSFRAPHDGTYFIRVRDVVDLGGDNATYRIVVRSKSYGADPVLVPEICNDRYEPDGLPQNAQPIKVNETQQEHRLCPTGDADWVKFYVVAGQTYALFTNTSRYTINPQDAQDKLNASGEPGADTVLALFGPDGRTMWGLNDNTSQDPVPNNTSGGAKTPLDPNQLDSNIRFRPPASGFYYAQIKNNGDIGDQQIRYDLKLLACSKKTEKDFNETQCNSKSEDLITGPPLASGSASGGIAPDSAGFAFLQRWQGDDQEVIDGRSSRSWMWGPRAWIQLGERYDQAPGGTRQVAYFDKGRMEINDPAGDLNSRWFITSGRLVAELISGSIQTGDTTAEQRYPADIPLAGDVNDPNGPTYASFGGVTSLPATSRKGQQPREQIRRDGRIELLQDVKQYPETTLEQFVGETRHNIPKVFWDYMTATPKPDWVYVLGYPLSEPYWAYAKIGDKLNQTVLIQPFERRVLTYVPSNPKESRVEMGNVGRHYYEWRYGQPPPN